jgi:hypothetical protein
MRSIKNDPPEAGTLGNVDLERQKLELEILLKKKELEALGRPPAPRDWWAVVVGILGAPTAVAGLAVAFTTATGNFHTQQKTLAETAQIQASMNKAADASKLAKDLTAKEKEGPQAFDKAVQENSEKIKDALESLKHAWDQ